MRRCRIPPDADRIGSWGPDQELDVVCRRAPRLHVDVRRGYAPTDSRERVQELLVLAVDPLPAGRRKQHDLAALVISGVYRQHAILCRLAHRACS